LSYRPPHPKKTTQMNFFAEKTLTTFLLNKNDFAWKCFIFQSFCKGLGSLSLGGNSCAHYGDFITQDKHKFKTFI